MTGRGRRAGLLAVVVLAGLAALPVAPSAPAAAAAQAPATTVEGLPGDLRLNQIQTIGTHNSFHVEPPAALVNVVRPLYPDIGLLEYTHAPLDEQLDHQRVRQIELDVYADSAGGRFADPALGRTGPEMDQPGFKVLHINDVDHASTCTTLVRCLRTVDRWSDANPGHLPVMVLVEVHATDEVRAQMPPALVRLLDPAEIEPPSRAQMDDLDAEIRSVFAEDELLTPDDVRGGADTLRDAVTTAGWPTLAESAGQVMFALDNAGAVRSLYEGDRTTLEGRVMFTSNSPGSPDAAFVSRPSAMGSRQAEIAELVAAGFMVRTRADATTETARSGSTAMRDAALASGAQWVSTDWPVPGLTDRFGSQYVAELPGTGVARCNPVSGSAACGASITVTQDADPDDATAFDFTARGTSLADFSLADDGRADASRTFTNLAPGTYTITQRPEAGWSLADLDCSGPAQVDVPRRRVTVTLAAGQAVACTFTTAGRPPVNDDFAAASRLSGTRGWERGTNSLATAERGEPRHAGRSGGASVWYRWTAPRAGIVTFTTEGSGFDTLLAVYTGSSVRRLDEIDADDDTRAIAPASRVRFLARRGVTYHIAVDGEGGRTGRVALGWSYAVG